MFKLSVVQKHIILYKCVSAFLFIKQNRSIHIFCFEPLCIVGKSSNVVLFLPQKFIFLLDGSAFQRMILCLSSKERIHIAQFVHTQMERRHQQKIADYCGITLNLIWHDAITVGFCHLSKIIAHTYYVLLYALSSTIL